MRRIIVDEPPPQPSPASEGGSQPSPSNNPPSLAGEGGARREAVGGWGLPTPGQTNDYDNPSSRRIASRSASRSGAASRVGGSAKAENFIGLPASCNGPVTGSSTATSMLRAAVCGCASAW